MPISLSQIPLYYRDGNGNYQRFIAGSDVSGYRTAAAQDVIDAQQDANIGIVQNTNTATQNISEGQYVIWHGALYTASAAIASGATLSGSNLTAVTGGGLNDLRSSIDISNRITWVSGFSGNGRKSNKICTISFGGSIQLSAGSWTNIGTISGIQISNAFNFSVADMTGNACIGRIKIDGIIQLYSLPGINLNTTYVTITFIED